MYTLLAALALVAVQHNRWSPVQMDFVGPLADEGDDVPVNPFLDYRLTVLLTGPDG